MRARIPYRAKINDFLRKRRKRLSSLKGDLANTPKLVHLATLRPVDLIALSHRVLDLRATREDWLELIENTMVVLESKKNWHEEAANIFVSTMRAIRSFDIELATQFGFRYLSRIDDERAKKTMVNMLLMQRKKEAAIHILQESKNSLWATRKSIELMEGLHESKSYEGHYLDLIGRNTLEVDYRPAILIYGDVNLNIIDGSSVWLSSVAEAFSGHGFDIHVLLKENIKREHLIENLIGNSDIRLIEPNQFGINDGELGVDQAIEIIEILDGIQGGYRSVILRGLNLCAQAAGAKSLWKRVWAYLTDYYTINLVQGRIFKPGVAELISDFGHVFDRFLIQTKEIKDNLIEAFGLDEDQIAMFPPIVPERDRPDFESVPPQLNLDVLKIGYCGKIAPQWGVRELIDVGGRAIAEGHHIEIHIIGDKVHADTPHHPGFRENIRTMLKKTEYVTWHGAQSRESAMELMESMDVAWCYRSPEFESQTLELSTKLLENMAMGLPTVVTRSPLHERLLGENHPLFVDTRSDIDAVISGILERNTLHEVDRRGLYERAAEHSMNAIRDEVIGPLLDSIEELPENMVKRILVNGHDLKFIGEFESHLKKMGHIVRRDRWEWGEPLDEERSRILLNWAEIIHSEWGLANAVWYSKNVRSDQHHVIRIHLQEINERAKRFPSEINTDNVDEIVFVAEHVRKIAVDMYDWHDTSTTTIQNHVDVNRHIGDKIGSAGKTLGLVGIIPMRKRLDRALDLVKILRKKDPEWKLIVKGRKPGDISFMHSPSRKAELEYYETQYRRVDVDPDLKNAVTFEGYTTTIASWYQKIGFVLSPSDFESFHFSVGDGVSSGAVPVIWPWEGADVIYPSSWVIEDTEQAAIRIMEYASGGGTNPQEERNRDYIAENYGCDVIFMKLRMALGLE